MSHGTPEPPYGPPIQQAIAKGDLQEMKKLAKQAELYLNEVGDLPAALELLKTEIARLERKKQ